MKNEPNEALEGRRLPVTISAISVLRTGTDRARQPSPSACALGKKTMPANVKGDFSNYPEPIREVFPHLYGEACQLRSNWEVYHHLFMANPERTEMLGKHIGALLGVFQRQLQDEMIFSIRRILDRDSNSQRNLSLWALADSCRRWDPIFEKELRAEIQKLDNDTHSIKLHRHKRIAHYDFSVSLKKAALPQVTFKELRSAIGHIERIINLVSERVDETTILFDSLDFRGLTVDAEIAAAKAAAYDEFISKHDLGDWSWKKYIK